jgi:hypothetical protein
MTPQDKERAAQREAERLAQAFLRNYSVPKVAAAWAVPQVQVPDDRDYAMPQPGAWDAAEAPPEDVWPHLRPDRHATPPAAASGHDYAPSRGTPCWS